MFDSNLFSKLEHDIENLQKDRDSVFYLDDGFYNKLIDLYIHNESKQEELVKTEVCDNKETIDDVRIGESKEEEPESSEFSEDNNSFESDEEEESSESESVIESSSDQIEELSVEGIGEKNQRSLVISKIQRINKAKPK